MWERWGYPRHLVEVGRVGAVGGGGGEVLVYQAETFSTSHLLPLGEGLEDPPKRGTWEHF